MLNLRFLVSGPVAAATVFFGGPSRAQDLSQTPASVAPDYVTQSVIDAEALGGSVGVVAVNVAAGDANLQTNAAALAQNVNGGSTARVAATQLANLDSNLAPDVAIARIGGHAFAGSAGLISINQASGQANAQANGVAFALGIDGEAIAESVLAQTLPESVTPAEPGPPRKGLREAAIADTAFEGAQGVVQVNQSAGSGNTTANRFALQVDAKL